MSEALQSAPIEISAQSLAEFEAVARRPLALRMRYAFIKTYKPVLDDTTYRSFNSMKEYRKWCNDYLPGWLGYNSPESDTYG